MSKEHGGSGGTVVQVPMNCFFKNDIAFLYNYSILQVSSILGLFNAHQPKGWAYNVSKSAVVSFVRCLGGGEAETGVRVLGLCPSVADTPILDGCSTEELDKIRRDVGGIMDKEQVRRIKIPVKASFLFPNTLRRNIVRRKSTLRA